jgi:uncharacterized membrane protein SpoIIM required for sporulation
MHPPTATSTMASTRPARRGTGDLRRTVIAAAVTALLLSGVGVAVGYGSFAPGGGDPAGERFALDSTGFALFAEIAGRNAGAALLLFSGVATLGATTVLGLVFVSAWVGAGIHAISDESGLTSVEPLVLGYLPLEFGGLLLAGVAGLLPLVAVVRRFLAAEPSDVSRSPVTGPALRLLALGIVLVVLGAAVETIVIHHQI